MVVDLAKPTLAYLQVADQTHQIYLTAGDDLTITLRSAGEDRTIFSTGSGSTVNNYLVQAARIEQQFYDSGGSDAFELNSSEFADHLRSIRVEYDRFHQQYADSVALLAELSEALQMRNRLKLVVLKENYQMAYYSDKTAASAIRGESADDLGLSYYDLPTGSSFLSNSLLAYDYAVALKMHLDHSVTWPLYDSLPKEAQDDIAPMVNQVIRSKKYLLEVEQFLVAYNVSSLMDSKGMTPTVDTLLNDFKERYSYSNLGTRLDAQYQRWLVLSPGRSAPPITGITPEGNPLSLGDLKGKVVYIDVWATWCGPCLKEFPHSKKVQQQFEGNNQVAFLYVSVDRADDREKWKKMVSNKELKGLHIIESPESEAASIRKAYLINGIPRYILVDQSGNIVDAEAERPSSGKVGDEIQRLLKG